MCFHFETENSTEIYVCVFHFETGKTEKERIARRERSAEQESAMATAKVEDKSHKKVEEEEEEMMKDDEIDSFLESDDDGAGVVPQEEEEEEKEEEEKTSEGGGMGEIEPAVDEVEPQSPEVSKPEMKAQSVSESLPTPPTATPPVKHLAMAKDKTAEEQEQVFEEEEEDEGWGSGWGNWGQALTGVAGKLTEAAKLVADDFNDMGKTLNEAVKESLEEDDKIGSPRTASSPKAADIQADNFEVRRAKFLEDVEDQTSQDYGLKKVDEQISFLATGAASFFGSVLGSVGNVVEGGVQNAQKLASTAANEFQETFQQGVSDVTELTRKSGAMKAASSGLKLAADHTVKLAEMSLEKAGTTAKGILDMADVVTGIDSSEGGGKGNASGEEEESLSFSHAFFIYGGPDHMEEIETISTKCGKLCQSIKVKLSGDNKVEYEALIKSLGERFDLSVTEIEGQKYEPLDSYSEVAKRCEGCTKQVEAFVNEQMSTSGVDLQQQIRVIKNEAVQQIAEQTAVSVHYLVKLGRSIAEPLGLFEVEEDIEWPEDPINVASILRATIESIIKDLKQLTKKFSDETTKFSQGNEDLKKPANDFSVELDEIHESATDKIREALR